MVGVRNPKVENEASIKEYALKTGIDTSDIAGVINVDSAIKLNLRRGLPEGIVFKASGEYIEYKETDSSCNAGLFTFIKALKKEGEYAHTDKHNLQDELMMMTDLKGQPLPEFNTSDYDFIVFIYWAKWEGKLNKDHVQEWQQLAADNKNARIKTFLVNLDMLEYYDKEVRDDFLKSLRRSMY